MARQTVSWLLQIPEIPAIPAQCHFTYSGRKEPVLDHLAELVLVLQKGAPQEEVWVQPCRQ